MKLGQGGAMAEIVNLNRFRKAKAKDGARADADANRAKFGRTKGEKLRDKMERDRADRNLDGAKRED